MIRTLIDPNIIENERVRIAISLLDVLDVEIISEKTGLTIEKVKELKKEYLNKKDIQKKL